MDSIKEIPAVGMSSGLTQGWFCVSLQPLSGAAMQGLTHQQDGSWGKQIDSDRGRGTQATIAHMLAANRTNMPAGRACEVEIDIRQQRIRSNQRSILLIATLVFDPSGSLDSSNDHNVAF